ncbi:MAG: hypothetical protein KDC56_12570, partial [Flavobacteriaceae bacterium]|nr:hypothetical protein [Flavobacteriaceae bacterium]
AGFNYFTYHLTADANLLAQNSKKKKRGQKELKIEKAKDGNYYLPKGEYTVKIMMGTDEASKKLVVK